MRLCRLAYALIVLSGISLSTAPSYAAGVSHVTAKIDLSQQKMRVYRGGRLLYVWPVSTARKGYRTPIGTFRPKRMHSMWYSRKYDMSPMPNSIFFLGGYAVHGTNYTRSLGRPASHGCVRLHPAHARKLYNMVKATGMRRTHIVVQR